MLLLELLGTGKFPPTAFLMLKRFLDSLALSSTPLRHRSVVCISAMLSSIFRGVAALLVLNLLRVRVCKFGRLDPE